MSKQSKKNSFIYDMTKFLLHCSLQLEANNEQLECLARDLELEKAKTGMKVVPC